MAKRRYLTIEDLYSYFSSNSESTHFSSKDNGCMIAISVPAKIHYEEDDASTLLPVTLKACHTGRNLNGSNIDKDNMEAALPSFYNKPILGYIHEVDGQPEFHAHDMHLDDDGDLVYDEQIIGIIPESGNAHLVYNEDKDNYVVVVNGYIHEDYTQAADIIRREEELSVSVELAIKELSYDAKERVMNLESFEFLGVTCLGKNDDGSDVQPGMAGSNLTLGDFSIADTSTFARDEELINAIEKLNDTLSRLNIDKFSEEGGESVKFNELLEKYGVDIDQIEFDYESMSDEELEIAFEEAFADEDNQDTSDEDEVFEEDDIAEETDESDSDSEEDFDDESSDDDEGDSEDGDDAPSEFSVSKTVSEEDGRFTMIYELSHDDIRYALYNLISIYDEADNDYYFIRSVYDDHVVFQGWCNNAIYGQKYSINGDDVSLDGERYALHEVLLTDSEYASLQDMRSNYDALKQFKFDADRDAIRKEKMDILNNEKFSVLKDNEDIKKLIEQIDNYEIADFEKEAKVILADYIVAQGSFSYTKEESEAHKIGFETNPDKVDEPYGTLFSKK